MSASAPAPSRERGAPIVVFGDEWGLHQTSVQHLARRLAATHPLLYVNTFGVRRPRWSLYDLRRAVTKLGQWMSPNGHATPSDLPGGRLYSPVACPLYQVGVIRSWNREVVVRGLRRRLQQEGLGAPILLVSSPVGAEVIGRIGERLLVYYVTDHYAALPGVYREYIEELERKLLAEADLTLVTSVALQRDKRGERGPVVVLPHGVDFEHFHAAADPPGPRPEELRGLPRPLLGFFGLLAPWVDVETLSAVARAFPQGSVVLIGPAWSDFALPRGIANLHWLGPRPYADLPRYAAHFDVGLIPFRRDALTACVNPLKLLEYMALGFPIVSTPLPDRGPVADLVYEAAGPEAFVAQVRRALAEDGPARRRRRFAVAAGESWDARLEALEQQVGDALRRRASR